MDLGLSGKAALVCASTAGLGGVTARALAAERADVVISARRGRQAREIAATLPSAIGVEVALTAPHGPEELVTQATSAFGDIDILVLNGPGPAAARAVDVAPEDVTAAIASLVQPHIRPGNSGRSLPSCAANPRPMSPAPRCGATVASSGACDQRARVT